MNMFYQFVLITLLIFIILAYLMYNLMSRESGNLIEYQNSSNYEFIKLTNGLTAYKEFGSKKNTPYAAQLAAEDATGVAKEAGLRKVKVYVKGPGNGRESAIRSIHNGGIEVTEIIDVTPTPHNGCRPPKRRRV